MERNQTRAEIIRIGTEIIGSGGFNATGLDSVLKKAQVPKGSFYYYFESKEDFGLAVIDQVAHDHEELLDSHLKDNVISPLKRIRNYLKDMTEKHESNRCKRGCLIGNLGQELASQNEKFRKRIEEVFETWKGRLADCLDEARKDGEIPKDSDPKQLASFLLAGWEGAILRAKVSKSVQPMKEFTDVLFDKVLR